MQKQKWDGTGPSTEARLSLGKPAIQSQEFMDFRRGQDGFLGLGANRQENDLSVIVLTKRQR